MLRSFNGTIDAEIAESKVSARMQHHQAKTIISAEDQVSEHTDDKVSQPDEDLE